jgi:hypothetical protein
MCVLSHLVHETSRILSLILREHHISYLHQSQLVIFLIINVAARLFSNLYLFFFYPTLREVTTDIVTSVRLTDIMVIFDKRMFSKQSTRHFRGQVMLQIASFECIVVEEKCERLLESYQCVNFSSFCYSDDLKFATRFLKRLESIAESFRLTKDSDLVF